MNSHFIPHRLSRLAFFAINLSSAYNLQEILTHNHIMSWTAIYCQELVSNHLTCRRIGKHLKCTITTKYNNIMCDQLTIITLHKRIKLCCISTVTYMLEAKKKIKHITSKQLIIPVRDIAITSQNNSD